MRLLTALALLTLSSTVLASETPVVLAVDTQPAFTTLNDAVIHGLSVASTHPGVEYGGVVYKIGQAFYYSEPVTLNEALDIRFTVRFQHGTKIVALYHTHPAGADSQWFSDTDVKTARDLNLPSYIAVQATNTIKVFTPGVDSVLSMGRTHHTPGRNGSHRVGSWLRCDGTLTQPIHAETVRSPSHYGVWK